MTHTQKILSEMQERADKATPGPWKPVHVSQDCLAILDIPAPGYDEHRGHLIKIDHGRCLTDPMPDAQFVAASRTDLPKLIAALRRAVEGLGNCADADYCGHPHSCHNCSALAEIEKIMEGK